MPTHEGVGVTDATGDSHVDALIRRYARGRSIKEIERGNGLPEGALSRTLRPSQRGRIPRLHIQERFAQALGAPLYEVSIAFNADNGVSLENPLPPQAQALLNDYLTLDDQRRALIEGIVRLAAEQQREEDQRDEDHQLG
jgi:transcriptional regulator with XRE-family HTH domain